MIFTLHCFDFNTGEYQPRLSDSFFHIHSLEDKMNLSKLSEDQIPKVFGPLRPDDIVRFHIMHTGMQRNYFANELVNAVINNYKRLYPNTYELKLNVDIYRY